MRMGNVFGKGAKLNFVALKYIGLLFMTISQIGGFLELKYDVFYIGDPLPEALFVFFRCLKMTGVLTMPLLLVSMTSSIASADDNIWKIVIKNLALTVVFYIGEILVFVFYIVPTINSLVADLGGVVIDSREMLEEMLGEFSNVNIYIDLFICSLIYLFFVYEPKNAKINLWAWRSLSVIPLAFIVTSFVTNGLIKMGLVHVNFYIGALLPNKKIVTYAFFFLVVAFIKYKGHLFDWLNKNDEISYEDYMNGDKVFRHHNLFLIVLVSVLSLIEFSLSFIPSIGNWGLGSSYFLFLAIPFLLFFNYRAKPKRKLVKSLIPVYYLANYALLFVLYYWFLF